MSSVALENDQEFDFRKFEKDKKMTSPGLFTALVIEDDVDMGINIESALRRNGWETTLVTSYLEAKNSITALRPRLLVLDWYLDNQHLGCELLDYYDYILNKFGDRNPSPIEVVTCSSAPEKVIWVPNCGTCHHVDHWQKPLTQLEIARQVAAITRQLR